MPQRTQAEADIALHLYGQRMRAIWDQRQADFEKGMAAFKEAAREDVTRVQEPKIEEPEIGPTESPNLDAWMKERTQGIEAPKIEPLEGPKKDEPDLDR